jgi:glycosyltransferase involved in cell wall biosynthesis
VNTAQSASPASDQKPLVSILAPAYNEADGIESSLDRIAEYMHGLRDRFRWELVIVDDGSSDETHAVAAGWAASRGNILVHRQPMNFGLGRALATGFRMCRGDYIVVLDIDLTYSPDHIEAMLERIMATRADIVIASPYMTGGKTSGVPFARGLLSRLANRFLALTARGAIRGGDVSTLTGMVRAYDAEFVRSLNLMSPGAEVNTEIIYKGMILGARIEEIPAHLDWRTQQDTRASRTSRKRLRRGIFLGLFAGYSIRPFAFFIIPSGLLALVSLYPLYWVARHVIAHYPQASTSGQQIDYVISDAVALAFQTSPHAFIVGGITLLLSVQLFSLGVVALQMRRNFEELFHFETRIYSQSQKLEQMLSAQAVRDDTARRD